MDWQKDKQTEQIDGKSKRQIEKKDKYSQTEWQEGKTDRQTNEQTNRERHDIKSLLPFQVI